MNEQNDLIYCSQCGGANPSTFKFCSNCGSKLEQSASPVQEVKDSEPISNQEPMQEQIKIPETSVYEKVEADVVSEGEVPPIQNELNINYGPADDTYDMSAITSNPKVVVGGGNSGFAIASMVCGIISLVCCCLIWLSLVLGIAAVVLGVIALKSNCSGKGMAIAGIITGGIGIFIWLICLLIGGLDIFSAVGDELTNF